MLFKTKKMPFKNLVYMYLRTEKFNDAELTLQGVAVGDVALQF